MPAGSPFSNTVQSLTVTHLKNACLLIAAASMPRLLPKRSPTWSCINCVTKSKNSSYGIVSTDDLVEVNSLD